MKENTITKYECEVCHTIYDNKEITIECEEEYPKFYHKWKKEYLKNK